MNAGAPSALSTLATATSAANYFVRIVRFITARLVLITRRRRPSFAVGTSLFFLFCWLLLCSDLRIKVELFEASQTAVNSGFAHSPHCTLATRALLSLTGTARPNPSWRASCSGTTTGKINPSNLSSYIRMKLLSVSGKARPSLLESSSRRVFDPRRHPSLLSSLGVWNRLGSPRDLAILQRLAAQLTRAGSQVDQGPNLLPAASWAWNVSTGELFWSRDIFGMLGFEPNDASLRYSAFLERVHPEDRTRVDQFWVRVARQKEDYELDYRFVSPAGDIKYLHTEGHPV